MAICPDLNGTWLPHQCDTARLDIVTGSTEFVRRDTLASKDSRLLHRLKAHTGDREV